MNNFNTSFIQRELDAAGVPMNERGTYVSVGVARNLAYQLPIPNEQVENLKSFFDENCAREVEQVASEINESVVIDIDFVVQLTYTLWCKRYDICHKGSDEETAAYIDSAMRGQPVVSAEALNVIHNRDAFPLLSKMGTLVARARRKE